VSLWKTLIGGKVPFAARQVPLQTGRSTLHITGSKKQCDEGTLLFAVRVHVIAILLLSFF
jgi:hypothetical protein